MTAYTVLATELHQQTSAVWDHGMLRVEIKKHRRGDTVSDLSKEDIARHLKTGAIATKSSDEAKTAVEYPTIPAPVEVPVPPDVPTAGAAVVEIERPKQAASKADWEEYAVASGWDPDEAAAASKAELVKGTK